MSSFPPGLILIIGALLLPWLPRSLRPYFALVLPLVGFIQLLFIADGTHGLIALAGHELALVRVDGLSLSLIHI